MTPVQNIEAHKGLPFQFTLEYSGDALHDRTGYTWAGMVREVAATTGAAEASFTFDTTQLPSTLAINLASAATDGLVPTKRYRYDVVETAADGSKKVAVRGWLRVLQPVTHA